MGESQTLPMIREVPHGLWEQIHPVILEMDSPKATGRKRVGPKRMLDVIIFQTRSSCQWNRLRKELRR